MWILKYWILRKDYDAQAQIYLTKKSLQLSDRKWEVIFYNIKIESCIGIKEFSFDKTVMDRIEQSKIYKSKAKIMA